MAVAVPRLGVTEVGEAHTTLWAGRQLTSLVERARLPTDLLEATSSDVVGEARRFSLLMGKQARAPNRKPSTTFMQPGAEVGAVAGITDSSSISGY